MKTINYKGKGEHSVRELELIIEQQAEELHLLKSGQKQLPTHGVSNCNSVKDPNIVKTYALITRKDGLTDVWCEGECLGKGLDTDGINKLDL